MDLTCTGHCTEMDITGRVIELKTLAVPKSIMYWNTFHVTFCGMLSITS